MPPMVSEVGVFKLEPVKVTNVPIDPLLGENVLITGACEKATVQKKRSTNREIFFCNIFFKTINLFTINSNHNLLNFYDKK